MRIDHGLKMEGDKLIITLPLEDGKKPSDVVVNGKIYAPQEKAQLSEEGTTKDATYDSISRKDAIDVVEFGITYAKAIDVNTGESKELFKEGNDALKKAVERLKELPSTKPEVIRCKDCKHWYSDADCGMACELTNMSQPEDGFCNWAERKEE